MNPPIKHVLVPKSAIYQLCDFFHNYGAHRILKNEGNKEILFFLSEIILDITQINSYGMHEFTKYRKSQLKHLLHHNNIIYGDDELLTACIKLANDLILEDKIK